MTQEQAIPVFIYCGKCGYILAGLSENRCPECGRQFDPGDPRTFRRKLPWSGLRLRLKQLGVCLLALMAIEFAVVAWFWWGWQAERPIIASIRAAGGSVDRDARTPKFLGDFIRWRLRPLGRRVYRVNLFSGKDLTDSLLEQLPGLAYLEALGIDESRICKDGLRYLRRIPDLHKLELRDCPLDDIGLEYLNDVPSLDTLELRVSSGKGGQFAKPNYRFLAGLKHVKNIVIQTRIEDADLQYVGKMESLEDLYLEGADITDVGMKYLASLRQIRRLSLFGTGVTGTGLVDLKPLSKMDTLNLERSTTIADESLAYLKDFPALRALWLQGSPVTDAGMKSLAKADLKGLTHLDLARTKVTDEGLAALASLPNLTYLVLGSSVTAEGAKQAKTMLPHLTFLSHDPDD